MTDTDIKLIEAQLESLRELLVQRADMTKEALVLQAREYERRLENLNNEAERLRNMQATYIPRESCVLEMKPLKESISDIEKWQSRIQGQIALMGVLAVVASGLVSYLIGR